MSYNSKHFVYHFFRSATEDFYSFSCFEAEMRYSNSRKRHQGTDQKQKKSSCNKENVMWWNSCYHNFKGLSYKMLCTLYPVTHGPTFNHQMLLPSFVCLFFFSSFNLWSTGKSPSLLFLPVSPRNISIHCSIFVAHQLKRLGILYILEFMTNGKQINVILFNRIVINSGVEVDMSALLPQHGRAIHTATSGQRFSWPGNKILTSTSLTTWILSHHWSWNSAQIVCSDFTQVKREMFQQTAKLSDS